MSKIHILNYKNYADRICDRLESLSEYTQHQIAEIPNIQFNPNDGIDTSQIVNLDSLGSGNYLIVSDNDQVTSRWYIMEAKWLRSGQTELRLRRDVVDEFIMDIKDQNFIIQRGIPPFEGDTFNPITFNDENIRVNKIKKGEVLVKDKNEYPWIIAYVDKQANLKYSYKETFQIIDPSTTGGDYPFENIPEIASNYFQTTDLQYNTNTPMENPVLSVYANAYEDHGDNSLYKYSYYAEQLGSGYSTMMISNPNVGVNGWEVQGGRAGYCDATRYPKPSDYKPRSIFSMKSPATTNAQNIGLFSMDAKEFKSYCLQANQQAYDCTTDTSELLNEIRKALGNPDFGKTPNDSAVGNILWAITDAQIIPVPTTVQRYYRFSATKTTRNRLDMIPLSGTVFNNFYNVVSSSFDPFEGQGGGSAKSAFSIVGEYEEYRITMDYIGTEPEGAFQIVSNSAVRNKHVSGLYDVICTPYVDDTYSNPSGASIQLNRETTLRFYQSLAALNGDAIYDIQIVPYGPKLYSDDPKFAFFKDSQTVIFSTNIESLDYKKTIDIDDLPQNNLGLGEGVGDAKWTKAHYITSLYRLCDPGYNGVFEFNDAANDGVYAFNVYVNLRPYNPFIHVAPEFNGLYGGTYDDARGLTCGSNFSVTTKSDAWATYELNNKNYQQIFNRQLQNLEVTHDIQDTQAIANAISGGVGGAVSGATAGAMVGGPIGAAIGGIGAGVASAIGGVADYNILQEQQAEQISYMKDSFKFQLDNIKALPDSLTRIGQQSQIFKYYPYVEYYSCSEEEEDIVFQYIVWKGMTINAIANLGYYIEDHFAYAQGFGQFLQAIPLRLELNEDTHMANELSKLLSKGIYLSPQMAHRIAEYPYTTGGIS